MKLLFCLVILAAVSLRAETWRPSDEFLDAVRYIESSNGQFVYGDGGRSLGDYQLSSAAWSDVNRWRQARGQRIYSYSKHVFNQQISRNYAADYLAILRRQLIQRLQRSPTAGEIYAAYNMGLQSFAQCRFSLDRVNSVTQKKCREIERRIENAQG